MLDPEGVVCVVVVVEVLVALPEVVAPPDDALISAMPLAPLARKVTEARPLASVLISDGSMVPSVVIKSTRVPLWGGVPEDSRTCATMVVEPFADSAVVGVVRVMDDPVGASSGTFSHAVARTAAMATATAATGWRIGRGIM